MDGTSGALYAIFLNALVAGLREQGQSSPQVVDAKIWAKALNHAVRALQRYTPYGNAICVTAGFVYTFICLPLGFCKKVDEQIFPK